MAYVIGVDVGGTFTDAVLSDDTGAVVAAKAPSTPPDYSEGVLDVLTALAGQLAGLSPTCSPIPITWRTARPHH